MSAKHGPNRLDRYLEIHETVMERLLRDGFVLADNLEFIVVRGYLYLTGLLDCSGGLRMQVRKEIRLWEEAGTMLAQTENYSYNAFLPGGSNIFRYDSPHATHNQEHHVHRYQPFGPTPLRNQITFLYHEEERPTLGEAINELEAWYWENYNSVTNH